MKRLEPIPEEKSSDFKKTVAAHFQYPLIAEGLFKYPFQARMDKVINIVKISETRDIRKFLLEEFIKEELYLNPFQSNLDSVALIFAQKQYAKIEKEEEEEEIQEEVESTIEAQSQFHAAYKA